MQNIEELVADGLVVKLELDPTKRYILIWDKRAVSSQMMQLANEGLRRMGIDYLILGIHSRPHDAILGLEIER